jgi:hypothetical protein
MTAGTILVTVLTAAVLVVLASTVSGRRTKH